MATLHAGSDKLLGIFRFGCFRLQSAVFVIYPFFCIHHYSYEFRACYFAAAYEFSTTLKADHSTRSDLDRDRAATSPPSCDGIWTKLSPFPDPI